MEAGEFLFQYRACAELILLRNMLKHADNPHGKTSRVTYAVKTLDLEHLIHLSKGEIWATGDRKEISWHYDVQKRDDVVCDIAFQNDWVRNRFEEKLKEENGSYDELSHQLAIVKPELARLLERKKNGKDIVYPQDFPGLTDQTKGIEIIKVMLNLEREGMICVNNLDSNFIYDGIMDMDDIWQSALDYQDRLIFNVTVPGSMLVFGGVVFNTTNKTVEIDSLPVNVMAEMLGEDKASWVGRFREGLCWLYALFKMLNEEWALQNGNDAALEPTDENDKAFKKYFTEASAMFWFPKNAGIELRQTTSRVRTLLAEKSKRLRLSTLKEGNWRYRLTAIGLN